jgi:hypothetical protein
MYGTHVGLGGGGSPMYGWIGCGGGYTGIGERSRRAKQLHVPGCEYSDPHFVQ